MVWPRAAPLASAPPGSLGGPRALATQRPSPARDEGRSVSGANIIAPAESLCSWRVEPTPSVRRFPSSRLRHHIRVWQGRRRHLGSSVTTRRCNRGSTTPDARFASQRDPPERELGTLAITSSTCPSEEADRVPPDDLPVSAIVSAPSERAGRSHRDPELLAGRNHPCGSDGSSGFLGVRITLFARSGRTCLGRGDAGSEPEDTPFLRSPDRPWQDSFYDGFAELDALGRPPRRCVRSGWCTAVGHHVASQSLLG